MPLEPKEFVLRLLDKETPVTLEEALDVAIDAASLREAFLKVAVVKLGEGLPDVLDTLKLKAVEGDASFMRMYLDVMGLTGKGASAMVQVVNQFGLTSEERRVLEADFAAGGEDEE
jgi:hypothetical protein